MISKNKTKLVNSLRLKKNRDKTGLFCAEGNKIVLDIAQAGTPIDTLIATNEWLEKNNVSSENIIEATVQEMKSISQLSTPTSVIAIIKIPKIKVDYDPTNELILLLDGIQDPGNLGTIIRMANWFGIHTLICSNNTVDCYNSKVIQATMGAIISTKIIYTNLVDFIHQHKSDDFQTFGTFLDGKNIYTSDLPSKGIIVLGNEGKGISQSIEKLVDQKLFIPSFTNTAYRSESLNVSVAASIVCSEFRRRKN